MVTGRNLKKAKGIRKRPVDFYEQSGINFSSNSTGDNERRLYISRYHRRGVFARLAKK